MSAGNLDPTLNDISCSLLPPARAVAIQATRRVGAAEGITADDTAGFKYVPGGRKSKDAQYELSIAHKVNDLVTASFVHRIVTFCGGYCIFERLLDILTPLRLQSSCHFGQTSTTGQPFCLEP